MIQKLVVKREGTHERVLFKPSSVRALKFALGHLPEETEVRVWDFMSGFRPIHELLWVAGANEAELVLGVPPDSEFE